MRLALGVPEGMSAHHQQRPDQARGRHRFARDGEVPVVVLHGRREGDSTTSPRNQVAELRASLQTERTARLAAERAHTEAQMHLQSVKTQLAHAELARREAVEAVAALRLEMQHLTLAAATIPAVAPVAVRADEPETAVPTVSKPVRAKRAAPARVKEQKPVKWWLPTFRGKPVGAG